jgi:hypothetical protein
MKTLTYQMTTFSGTSVPHVQARSLQQSRLHDPMLPARSGMRDASDTNDESNNHGGAVAGACGLKQTAETHPCSEYVEPGEERGSLASMILTLGSSGYPLPGTAAIKPNWRN